MKCSALHSSAPRASRTWYVMTTRFHPFQIPFRWQPLQESIDQRSAVMLFKGELGLVPHSLA